MKKTKIVRPIFGAVENGITRRQFDRILKFVQAEIFDGCGLRKIRAFHLIENGEFLGHGKIAKVPRSYTFSLKYPRHSPITNIDRIVENIVRAVKPFPNYAFGLRTPESLKNRLLAEIGNK